MHRNRSRIAMAAGCALFVAGVAIGITTLSPMFVPATMVDTAAATSEVSPSDRSLSGRLSAPAIVDGPVNGVAFTIEVPAAQYRATVQEGIEKAQLDRGPGHYPETAWPGRPGNVGVAAHNVYWLSFNRLKPGDRVIITTRHFRIAYVITGMQLASPNDTSVLAQTPAHLLTLTTCYPLWAGALATERLVFHASEVDSELLDGATRGAPR